MARINIEDCWWTDPRRSLLIQKTGSEINADGSIIKAWRLAQQFWKIGRGLIPIDLFETLPFHKELVDSKLAEIRNAFVYVRGSSSYLDWVREKNEQAKVAGKKSAESRKQKNGTAQPQPSKQAKSSKTVEPNPNDFRTESNDAEPSDSYSYSPSGSSSDSDSNSATITKISSKSQKANAFVAAYCDRFKLAYGHNPEILGKEAGTASRLAKTIGLEKFERYLDAYFSMPDSWLVKIKHPLSVFETKLNEIVVFANTGNFTTNRQVRQADDHASNMILLNEIRQGKI